MNVRDLLMGTCALPFYALGWLTGAAVRLVRFVVAAVVAGYRSGAGTG